MISSHGMILIRYESTGMGRTSSAPPAACKSCLNTSWLCIICHRNQLSSMLNLHVHVLGVVVQGVQGLAASIAKSGPGA